MVIIGGPAIVPALLRALCREQTSISTYTPHHTTPHSSSTSSTSSNHPSPSSEPDINRLHPTNSNPHNQLSNIQASATGLILENPADAVNGGVKARVLIVNNTPERGSGGYVGLMNSVFAAQKRVSRRLHVHVHVNVHVNVQMASLRRTDPYYVFLLAS